MRRYGSGRHRASSGNIVPLSLCAKRSAGNYPSQQRADFGHLKQTTVDVHWRCRVKLILFLDNRNLDME